jgi:hypothetical protein
MSKQCGSEKSDASIFRTEEQVNAETLHVYQTNGASFWMVTIFGIIDMRIAIGSVES